MSKSNNQKKEWNNPTIQSIQITETMNNGLYNGNGNGFGHCKHGEVPGIGNGHDKYDGFCS